MPTGTVTFQYGLTSLGTASLSAGAATFSTAALGAGNATLNVIYGGDSNFTGNTVAATQLVNQDNSTTTLTSMGTPSVYGQPVRFIVAVAAAFPGSTWVPTGTVTFADGGTSIGTANLTAGSVTWTTDSLNLPNSPHTITAAYAGDSNFGGSTSSLPVLQTVTAASTTTTVMGTPNPADQTQLSPYATQLVTFTATVTAVSPGAAHPTGNVTFLDGGSLLSGGIVPLNASGVATFTTTSLSVTGSPHTITAVYKSDINFLSSTSTAPALETIRQLTTTSVTSSSSGALVVGVSIGFTATVHDSTGNPATAATGTVTFVDNGTSIGTGLVAGGAATYTTSTLQLPAGTDTITAIYGGDVTYGVSTSAAFLRTVSQASTSITLAQPPTESVYGQNVTFSATVSNTVTGLCRLAR